MPHEEAIRQAYGAADAVFWGRARTLEYIDDNGYPQAEFTFDVIESWKGVTQESFKIRTGYRIHSCGVGYDIGKETLSLSINVHIIFYLINNNVTHGHKALMCI